MDGFGSGDNSRVQLAGSQDLEQSGDGSAGSAISLSSLFSFRSVFKLIAVSADLLSRSFVEEASSCRLLTRPVSSYVGLLLSFEVRPILMSSRIV